MINLGAVYCPNDYEFVSKEAFDKTIQYTTQNKDIVYQLPARSNLKVVFCINSNSFCLVNDGGNPQATAAHHAHMSIGEWCADYEDSIISNLTKVFPLHKEGIFSFLIDNGMLVDRDDVFDMECILESALLALDVCLQTNRLQVNSLVVILSNSNVPQWQIEEDLASKIPQFISALHGFSCKESCDLKFFSLGTFDDCRGGYNYSYNRDDADCISAYILNSGCKTIFERLKSFLSK